MKKFLYVFLFLIAGNFGFSQVESIVRVDSIPFVLTEHNNIVLQTVLNEGDTVDLMLHTAVSSISIIDETIDRMKTMRWNDEYQVESWGGKDNSKFSGDNSLSIHGFTWDSLEVWSCKRSGPATDGKFGLNLFENKVVEINYDLQMLIIRDSLPADLSKHEAVALTIDNGLMFIEGISSVGESKFPNRYLVHTGYGGNLLYDDEFVKSSEIGKLLTLLDKKELKDSYGNIIEVKTASLPLFHIGSLKFRDIPVGFFEGAIGRQSMSVIGGGFLKMFNMVFDAERKNVYLRPNSLMLDSFADKG